MKVNKLAAALMVLSIAGMIVLGIFSDPIMLDGLKGNFAGDFRLREAEIRCAHQGINSFHVWNRDQIAPGFHPYPRPDMADVDRRLGELTVHAYPPWHTVFFWFLGWLPSDACLALMACLFGACFVYIAWQTFEITAERCDVGVAFVAWLSLLLITRDVTHCFIWMNYGVLILALYLLMYAALRRKMFVLAGFCWAAMMIKPQVSTLFFWPLVFGRRYKTIFTAMGVCLGMTLLMAFWYGESPIALVLQIPQIGLPYGSTGMIEKTLTATLGDVAKPLWMLTCFVVCGVFCYLLRRAGDFLLLSVPAVLITPLWTYGQRHDHVILLIWYVVALSFATHIESAMKRKLWIGSFIAILGCGVFCAAWVIGSRLEWFGTHGIGWLYQFAEYVPYLIGAAMLIVLVRRYGCKELA